MNHRYHSNAHPPISGKDGYNGVCVCLSSKSIYLWMFECVTFINGITSQKRTNITKAIINFCIRKWLKKNNNLMRWNFVWWSFATRRKSLEKAIEKELIGDWITFDLVLMKEAETSQSSERVQSGRKTFGRTRVWSRYFLGHFDQHFLIFSGVSV